MLVLYSLLIVSLLLYLWIQRRSYVLAWKLGGPIGLPFIGSVKLLSHETILEFFEKIGKKYSSPCTVWCGSLCMLFIRDPVNMKRILNSPECNKKSFFYNPFTEVGGSGLVTSTNPEWSTHRKLLNPMFKIKILTQFTPTFDIETKILCKKFKELSKLNRTFDISVLLMEYVLLISSETVGGYKSNLQYGESDLLLKTFKKVLDTLTKMMFSPLYRFPIITKVFDRNFHKESEKCLQITHHVIEECIEENSKRVTKTSAEPLYASDFNFMKHFINLNRKGLFSSQEVMGESKQFIMTSTETLTKGLLHICTLLAMHPEWQEKLHQYIEDRFPDNEAELSSEHIQNTPLIHMIIKESLRLLPVVPLLGRETNADFVLFDDIVVPKGTNIVLDLYSIQRDPKYWGPDVLEFNPYRFLNDEVSGRHPYVYIPFSKGPRNCIGWLYANIFLKVFIINIFRRFRLSSNITVKPGDIKFIFGITSKMTEQPLFKVEDRFL